MKNIVLVTWIGGGNYGTSLQSFALHRKLELLGLTVGCDLITAYYRMETLKLFAKIS